MFGQQEILAKLRHGAKAWNEWRESVENVGPTGPGGIKTIVPLRIDLAGADLSGFQLDGANLNWANMSGATLCGASLVRANLEEANLEDADLTGAKLHWASLSRSLCRKAIFREGSMLWTSFQRCALTDADLSESDLVQAHLDSADLQRANLERSDLSPAYLMKANLSHASLQGANLGGSDLSGACLAEARLEHADLSFTSMNGTILTGASLVGANLEGARLINTALDSANISRCRVYGISPWEISTVDTKQDDLIITPWDQTEITVDNLEIAQFIYLILNNKKIRDVINTVTSKVVLILGRFSEARKGLLNGLRNELREHDYLPVLFDFGKPTNRDLTETVSTLAHLSRFVIADLTEARCVPQELMAFVPILPSVPVVPILNTAADTEYAMFKYFKNYPWVLPVCEYIDDNQVLARLDELIIRPAERKMAEMESAKGNV